MLCEQGVVGRWRNKSSLHIVWELSEIENQDPFKEDVVL